MPVQLLARAKTRLSAYGDDVRAELALAFADDVVTAALDGAPVSRVLVVTDDVRAAGALARPGVSVVPDPGAGLNPALVHGAAALRGASPQLGVASLCSDLPALRASDLADALDAVHERGFVPDADGVGTTLLAAAPSCALLPSYGPDSRRRHLASGALELSAAAGLRRDVDTPADLEEALRLGVGPRTGAVVAALV